MKNLIEKLKTVDKGTIIRTIALVLALANQFVAVIGSTSFANEPWYQVVSIIITIVMAAYNAWENNDFTHFAKLATGILNALQDGKITEDEVKELLEKGKDK